MASPFQQQARTRKFVYLGLILVLLAGTLFWRKSVVEASAEKLAILEQSRGEVELTGALVRHTTIGLRGVATCVLWSNALDKQKKNQWNELEVVVRMLTKLQPHFITPWQFQSWNLAYNVSVESDRVADKFFYVSRGVLLLGEGERQNKHHPDLRFFMGFYNQNKMHVSDEANVMRTLFQLTMIPPNERDPARFRKLGDDGRVSINWPELEQFCKDHPQLVRRLREGIRRDTRRELQRQFTCQRAEDLIQFLGDSYAVPSVWENTPAVALGAWRKDADSPRLKSEADRYPPLPPERAGKVPPPQRPWDPGGRELNSSKAAALDDSHDVHVVARAWYGYSMEPVPPPGQFPGENGPIEDRAKQRRPKQMTTLIFRHYPARAQSYNAERLQQEGWFADEGYEIPDWFERRDDGGATRPIVGGGRTKWSQDAWEQAAQLWREHGQDNHLLFRSEADEQNTNELAIKFYRSAFAQERKITPGSSPPETREETLRGYDPELVDQYRAAKFAWDYGFYRSISNFAHHYTKALADSREENVLARKHFARAERLRLSGRSEQALDEYLQPEAIQAWRDKVLLRNKEFRRDNMTREDTYEVQASFLDLLYDQYGRQLKQRVAQQFVVAALAGQLAQAGARPALVPEWYPLAALSRANPLPQLKEVVYGPFDLVDEDGVPLVTPEIAKSVDDRRFERSNRNQAEKQQFKPRAMLSLDGKPITVKEPPPAVAPLPPPMPPGGAEKK